MLRCIWECMACAVAFPFRQEAKGAWFVCPLDGPQKAGIYAVILYRSFLYREFRRECALALGRIRREGFALHMHCPINRV